MKCTLATACIFVMAVVLGACSGGSQTVVTAPVAYPGITPADELGSQGTWPTALPRDAVMPWEEVDASGYVIPPTSPSRGLSGINADSDFTPGLERHGENGSVTDVDEASRLTSGTAGSGLLSWALYRIPMGGAQPGVVSTDVNLRPRSDGSQSDYWIGVGNYNLNKWDWYGPFSENHIRLSLPALDYTNTFGNMFVVAGAYDGADFDLVGIGINPRDNGDTTPPGVPAAPVLTPVAGGLWVEWLPVADGGLAGYRIYHSSTPFTSSPGPEVEVVPYLEGGRRHLLTGLTGTTYVRISAVDISGNESAASAMASETPLAGEAPALNLTVDQLSGMVGFTANLTATGADTYDWDLDGDGTFDVTGDATGSQVVDTGTTGIIRPMVRGASGGAVMAGAVSLIVTSNSRPVANAYALPTSGVAPLTVTLSSFSEDFDGTIEKYWWDIDGDSGWDYAYVFPDGPNPPPHTFTDPGTYNVKLRVTDDQGDWDIDTVTVTVHRPGQWEHSPADFSNGSGQYPAVAIVNGRPAVAYYHGGPGFLTYVRALDKYGLAWDTPITVVASGGAGLFCDLEVIDGFPAIAYFDGGPGEVRYIRADNADGTSWTKAPVTIEATGTFEDISLAEINGNPAMVYLAGGGNLNYRRASSLAGTGDTAADWVDPPVTIDASGDVGGWPSLALINGNPAVGYFNGTALQAKYIRAVNSTGQTGGDWPGASVTVSGATQVGGFVTLQEVNGRPAMSYWENAISSVQYIRALTANGLTVADWPAASVTVDSGGGLGTFVKMAVIDGRPAVAYYNFTPFTSVAYRRAADVNGGSWGPKMLLSDNTNLTNGQWLDLIENMKQPFLAGYNTAYGYLQVSFIPAQ